MAGADLVGLNRLAALGRQRAAETGRTSPSDADLDWAVAKATPAEISTWATPEGFAALEQGMKGGDGTMAKKSISGRIKSALGVGKKSRGAKKRGSAASVQIIATEIGPMVATSRPAKRKGSAPKKPGLFGRIKAAITKRRAAPRKAKKSTALVMYSPGANVPAVRSSRSSGGLSTMGKGKGLEMLTMGTAVIVGGAAGYALQKQPAVTLPWVGWQVRRGSLAFVAGVAITLATRKRYPKIARHAAALTVGIATGAAAEVVGTRMGAPTV